MQVYFGKVGRLSEKNMKFTHMLKKYYFTACGQLLLDWGPSKEILVEIWHQGTHVRMFFLNPDLTVVSCFS